MPNHPVYVQCGLRMRSEVEVALPVATGSDWDLDVRWGSPIHNSDEPPPGETIASYGEGSNAWYTVTQTDVGYLIRFRRCGEFAISSDLNEIEVRRDPDGRHELLPILLAGTVGAIVLTLRGSTVLHASAVTVNGGTMAFVGHSGRGKSTVAALMCVDGAKLVTDDVLVVDAGPPPACIGGASELRLREKAAEIANQDPAAITRTTEDERTAFGADPARPGRRPLSAIVIPTPSRTVTRVVTERMVPSEALTTILSFPRVHGWRRPDVLSREFTTLGGLVNTVPIYQATIPWGPPFSAEIAPALTTLA